MAAEAVAVELVAVLDEHGGGEAAAGNQRQSLNRGGDFFLIACGEGCGGDCVGEWVVRGEFSWWVNVTSSG